MGEHRFRPAIATQSLGDAEHHRLDKKLALCSQYGFEAVEIFYADLEASGSSLPENSSIAVPGTSFPDSSEQDEQLLAAADHIRELCTEYQLKVLCLQPFMHYEGLLDPEEHGERIKKLRLWIRIAKRMDTDLIQIPSNFLSSDKCSGDHDRIIRDLRHVADIGLEHTPPIRFAYEALAWGTHVDKWDEAWQIVTEVGRHNFGTCLDTFNLAGRVYADPSTESGKNASADTDILKSIEKLRTQLDPSKIFYVEACDGERLDHPINPNHEWYDADQPARMTWSRNARLFPLESKGYLPVLEILKAICDTGFTGYVSFELFSRTANQLEQTVPEDHAKRAQTSWRRLAEEMGWNNSCGNGTTNTCSIEQRLHDLSANRVPVQL